MVHGLIHSFIPHVVYLFNPFPLTVHCSLNGTIPTEIGGLSMLTTLFLGDSFDKTRYLTGTIPTQIGKMTLLQEFSIRNARLTGAIPSTIINLWNLTELYVTGNKMSGDIPLLPENVTKCEVGTYLLTLTRGL